MIRAIGWTLFYILTLGFACIQVEYTDGVSIKLHGWFCEHRKETK